MATVTTMRESIAERPDAMPRPPPLTTLLPWTWFSTTTLLPPPATTALAAAAVVPLGPAVLFPLSQHQQQQDITTQTALLMGTSHWLRRKIYPSHLSILRFWRLRDNDFPINKGKCYDLPPSTSFTFIDPLWIYSLSLFFVLFFPFLSFLFFLFTNFFFLFSFFFLSLLALFPLLFPSFSTTSELE